MKKILLLFFLLFIQLVASAQFTWLNPQPSGFSNIKIRFINDKGYMMNGRGDLFITSDTGTTWEIKKSFPNSHAFCINDSTGVIPAPNSAIYLSTDNGSSWEKRSTGIAENLGFWVDIIGKDTIFLLSGVYSAHLYKSVNRGISWVSAGNTPQVYFSTIDFLTSMRGYASGPEGIFKTTDGGATWQNIYPTSNSSNITSIRFRDTLNGFAFRESTGILKTTDGGISWTMFNTPPFSINEFSWTSPDHAFAAADYGYFLKTSNAGLSWEETTPTGFMSVSDLATLHFLNDSIGIIAGSYGAIGKTTDGGNSWQHYSPTYRNITAVSFGDSLTGYASIRTRVYKTVDKGQNWAELPLQVEHGVFSNSIFEQAYFWSSDSGILTASHPARLYKTTNGGQTWDSIYPKPANPLAFTNIRALSFINKDTGFLYAYTSGSDGVYGTTNGGNSWQLLSNNNFFTRMQFLNSQVGYASRATTLWRTINGGSTWNQVSIIPAPDGLNDIFFTSPSKGFIIYNSNYIKMTTDSGHTWSNVYVVATLGNSYTRIRFLDQNTGFMDDDDGYIYKTIDGGLHWGVLGKLTPALVQYSVISSRADSTIIFGRMGGAIVTSHINSYAIDSLGAVSVCLGGDSSIKAITPDGFSWRWQLKTAGVYQDLVNGPDYSGVDTAVLRFNNVPASFYDNEYRCIVNGTNSELYTLKFANRWTGSIDSTWENPGNWSCGVLPDANTDVIISSGTVVLNSNTTIGSLLLSPGVSFTINPPYTLTIVH